MGRRRRSGDCCGMNGANFNTTCFNLFVGLKIFVWICIWIYLIKYYVVNEQLNEQLNEQSMDKESMDKESMNTIQIVSDVINALILKIINPRAVCFIAFISLFIVGSLNV